MEHFDRGDLRKIFEVDDTWCVSIYLPTHRKGRETAQDPIRFRNLLRKSTDQLLRAGVKTADAEKILALAHRLSADEAFWRHQSDGLAVFLSAPHSSFHRLPGKFPEVAEVSRTFHVKPLLQFLVEEQRLYCLALSRNDTRLYLLTAYGIDQVEIEGMPRALTEVVAEWQPTSSLQTRSSSRSGSGPGAKMFHGHSDEGREREDFLRFFRAVDRALRPALEQDRLPLVLCGVDTLCAHYRSVTTYPMILSDAVSGSPDAMSPEEIRERATALAAPWFKKELDEALGRYRELAGTGKTTNGLEETLPMARGGRIDTLFLSTETTHPWGRWIPESNTVVRESTPTAENEDLVDRCAREAFLTGAHVLGLTPDRMPEKSEVAAILRF